MVSERGTVVIYTDGACIGNPGPGGYGAVIVNGKDREELSGGYRRTTNNRMELLAAIEGLGSLKGRCRVTLYSDSTYLVKAMTQGWAQKWRTNGWRRGKRERAINPDLWERLLRLDEKHTIEFRWVRGHSGVPGNERCDELARQAAQGRGLMVDEGYENETQSRMPL